MDSLQDLRDRAELTDLLARQGRWLDERRYDDDAFTASVFTPDAVAVTGGGRAEGRTELIAQARRAHDRFTVTQHLTTGVAVDLDGDRAAVRANLVAVLVPGENATPIAVGEVYRFDAVRTPDGWRFASVEATRLWRSGEVPAAS
ncbi:nuclear transport factor 2 family protein [Actinomadura atramentaria]|uniref:nuclear transport factor 2 family protein n=1 Tax=Actinomadura atramentaria TaxID=1990 RepID=UPI00036C75FF|nr:nuclear transport factor 2 family protein [Actinomadura atramentaria]